MRFLPYRVPRSLTREGISEPLCVDCHLNLHGRKAPDPEVLAWQEFVRLPNHQNKSVIS